jgi:hypothetical protein
MGGDPHADSEKLFKLLREQATNKDAKLLLLGMERLCLRIEENGAGMQENSGELAKRLGEIEEALNKILHK